MKKMRMCFPREKTFADGFKEYVLDCKARNLRDGTIHHYLVYFAGVFIFHLVQLFKVIPDTVNYYQCLPGFKEAYVETFEAEINRLHRYLRLRELWIEKEKLSTPTWLIFFESRLMTYEKEYNKLTK